MTASRKPPSDAEFTELVHGAWPSLYRTAYLMLGDHALAEDLVQTALARRTPRGRACVTSTRPPATPAPCW